jgi:hypothetical protein
MAIQAVKVIQAAKVTLTVIQAAEAIQVVVVQPADTPVAKVIRVI